MDTLFKKHATLISQVDMGFVRGDIDKVKWDKSLVGIKGSRGVGKTTLIRQYIRRKYGVQAGEALYCVADGIYFSNHTILELAEQFHVMGGRHLFIDEVHKYEHWSRELKEINDLYPDMKVTFSGSSLIEILNADADLSRRALPYMMYGLSFREYLQLRKGITLSAHSLEDILENADDICREVNAVCTPQLASTGSVQRLFNEYLRIGYYPFYDGDEDEYYDRLENVVNYIIEQELPMFCSMDMAYIRKVKAMLAFLASNVPYQVNIAKLASYLEINKSTVLSYLGSLQRAELLNLLYSDNKSVTKMQKPDKILVSNTNLLCMLHPKNEIGTLRESFAVNQLSTKHTVEYAGDHGDFKVDGRYQFEIGGKDKSFTQIAGIEDSYVFADEIEIPVGNKIPLWLLGMMY